MSGGAHHAGLLAEGEAGGGARAGHVPPRGPHPQAGPATLPGCGPGFEVQCSAAAPCVRALLVAVAGSSLGSQGQGHAAPACVQGVYGLVGWGAGACKVCMGWWGGGRGHARCVYWGKLPRTDGLVALLTAGWLYY